ncbi:transketolase [Tenuifilaceae bacterium CYCD]|nr:transketolase [Tenuifilaceae bacterium CYCD]
MKTTDVQQLIAVSKRIREDVITSLAAAGSGHLGGSLGLADVFTTLYFDTLNHRSSEPLWSERDRLILSIGHVAPVLYASLANAGYFSRNELSTLRKLGTRLQGHPGRDHGLPGIELSAGSLGQGLSVAVGIALTAKIDKVSWRVYSIHGDGELQEGSIWEAAMSASHYKLDNLIAIVDRNYCQIDGRTSKVMELEPLADKWKSFGWNALECDGNNIESLISTLDLAKRHTGSPTVIIAKTKMGFGVKSIEDDYRWHGKAPNAEEAKRFLLELYEYYSNILG